MNTELSIAEGNELIVEFMGRYRGCDYWGADRQMINEAPKRTWEVGKVKYHSSWSWIMPVVKKIAGLVIDKDWDKLSEALSRWKPLCNELQKVNLDGAWYCVVKFIQWYNKQK